MKKTPKPKRLVFSRQTIAKLVERDLAGVCGGDKKQPYTDNCKVGGLTGRCITTQ